MTENLKLQQERLNEVQGLYREWQRVQTQLESAQKTWQHAAQVMAQLEQFYFQGEYRAYLEAEEQGTVFSCQSEGEHSVLSEDALWNAFHEYQTLAWQQLRQSLAVVEPKSQDE